jgi:ribosomal protein L37AE/L43A
MPVKNNERRAVYLERKKRGLCPRCGARRRKKSKFVFCDDCRAFFRNYNENISEYSNRIRKARYDERKENNQCPRCGKNLGKRYKKTICLACLEKQYRYNYGKSRPKKK